MLGMVDSIETCRDYRATIPLSTLNFQNYVTFLLDFMNP